LLVDLFESYDDARTYKHQTDNIVDFFMSYHAYSYSQCINQEMLIKYMYLVTLMHQ